MSIRTWLGSPGRHVATVLAVTLVPSVLLVALGWMLFQQDRAGALRQLEERRREAANLVVAELERHLTAAASALANPDEHRALVVDDGAVVVTFSPTTATIVPAGRVSYVPVAAAGREADAAAFAAGERIEHAERNPAAAVAWFRRLAASPDPAIRAGALIRMARNLRKTGQIDEALDAYDEAAGIDAVSVAGTPVDLFARAARCDLLAASGRHDELRTEARALLADLRRGAWTISRAVYEVNAADTRKWAGDSEERPNVRPTAELLAAAASELWDRGYQRGPFAAGDPAGREFLSVGGLDMTVLWSRAGGLLTALIAAPDYVERRWLGSVQPALAFQRVRVALHAPGASADGGPRRPVREDLGRIGAAHLRQRASCVPGRAVSEPDDGSRSDDRPYEPHHRRGDGRKSKRAQFRHLA